jgi:hypothetical protein
MRKQLQKTDLFSKIPTLINYLFLVFLAIFSPFINSLNAQVNSPPYMPPGANTKPNMDTFGLDLGINNYDKDYYLYVNPTFNFNFDKWGIGFQVPLNLLLIDKDPKVENSRIGLPRAIDYNTKSDYQRILNYIYFGNYGIYNPNEITYSIYIGKMFDGYIGHGTIVNRYVNNLNIDNYKQGVMADINTDWGGVQYFTNSVMDRKEVNAFRAYIRPFGIVLGTYSLFSGNDPVIISAGNVVDDAGRRKVLEEVEERTIIEESPDGTLKSRSEQAPIQKFDDAKPKRSMLGYDSFLNRFAIGFTQATDATAPFELKYDSTGALQYSPSKDPLAISTKKVVIEGYDLEFKIFNFSYFELTPYIDYNRIKFLESADGTHYGVFTKFGGRQINLTLKPEFRSMKSHYLPIYFDSFYELERFQTNLGSPFPYTKYESALSKDPDGGSIKGYYHTAILNIYNIGIEGTYEDYEGKDNSRVFLGLYIPIGKLARISGFYQKKGFDKFGQAFKADDKAMGIGEIAVPLGPVVLKVQNRRRWILNTEENQYKSTDEYVFMVSGGTNF